MHEGSARMKQIKLTTRLTSKLRDPIESDANKIKQVVANLLSNAIKFTEQGSVEIGTRLEKSTVVVYVRDTGIGIHHDVKEKIFERFYQAEMNTTRTYGGNGLGLTIARAYVTLLGGEIWLKSTSGQGSTFYFSLPQSTSTSQVLQKQDEHPAKPDAISGQHILVVEDDMLVNAYLKEIFKGKDLNVSFACNGFEALEVLRSNLNIKLVITDIKMPGMDGYDLLKEVRKTRPEIIVIAQSAFVFSDEKQKILSAGFDDYLPKPLTEDDLMGIIAFHLQ
jgi:CheY-like chemotaxis protein